MLLDKEGYDVISALREHEALLMCSQNADLMVLGHSVPQNEKREFIKIFRRHCNAPVLSLLRPLEDKLPEATFGIESMDPINLIRVVREILPLE